MANIYIDTTKTNFRTEPGPDEFTDVIIGRADTPDDQGNVLLVGGRAEMLAWLKALTDYVERNIDNG